FLFRHAEEGEHAHLEVATMDSDAPPAQLDPVDHEVVSLRSYLERHAFEAVQILVPRRGEGMVDGSVAAALRIPLEEREVHDPREAVFPLRDPAEPLTELQPEAREDARGQGFRLRQEDEEMTFLESRGGGEKLALRVA